MSPEEVKRSGLIIVVSLLETAQRRLPVLPAIPGCEGIQFKATLHNYPEETCPLRQRLKHLVKALIL